MWNYDAIGEQIARAEAGCRLLQPASLVTALCALSQMESGFQWQSNNDELTTGERDIVEAWIAQAYIDLLTEVECG